MHRDRQFVGAGAVLGLRARYQQNWLRRIPCGVRLRKGETEFGTGEGGRLFRGTRTVELPKITYIRAWKAARVLAFTDEVAASPLGATPYSLRHACVSTWLNGGVPATQVAEWAGHSVEVLLKLYAKCLDGQDEVARRRVLDALGHRAS
jgi:integrase